jgi:hypothetical protein
MWLTCCAPTTVALGRPGIEFAARLGADPLVAPRNHMALLTRPDIVADALISLI